MDHTIAAVATAIGEGGIGIVRISGHQSLDILKKVFRYRSGRSISEIQERRMVYGNICDGSAIIDEAMVVYMKAPHTYTGEDVVEIQCHGSVISLRKILKLVLDSGAQMAQRGEFTQRAFLNGRLDLSQAEAVIDVIKAKSDLGYGSAMAQLQGSLSNEIKRIRKNMADLIADIVAHIEYPEEDLEEITYENIISSIDDVLTDIKKLADSSDTGRAIRDGLKLSIAGRPNVGKSSLMNSILKADRAIVTDIPGTTRDTIEEFATIGGIPVRLTDTAGIRETDDIIEKMGIEKSRESISAADVVIMMIDSSSELTEEDAEIMRHAHGKKTIVILNKSDLEQKVNRQLAIQVLPITENTKIIEMSAATGEGVDDLVNEIKEMVYNGEASAENEVMITNIRHIELLENSMRLLTDARGMLECGEALDFAESDIREAWMSLGEITGEAVNDDIVKEVFARFCLGK